MKEDNSNGEDLEIKLVHKPHAKSSFTYVKPEFIDYDDRSPEKIIELTEEERRRRREIKLR